MGSPMASLSLLSKSMAWLTPLAIVFLKSTHMLKNMWVDFRNTIASGVNHAIDLLNKLRDAIGLPMIAHVAIIAAPSNTTGVGSNQRMSGNAKGTDNWRGGPTRINEEGGEIVDLPGGTRIIPHDVSMGMAKNSNSESNKVIVYMNGTVIREEADIHKLASAIVTQLDAAAANM